MDMKDKIKELNKKSLADATGISYGRLRKFAAGQIKELTSEEIKAIYDYLIDSAKIFTEVQNDSK